MRGRGCGRSSARCTPRARRPQRSRPTPARHCEPAEPLAARLRRRKSPAHQRRLSPGPRAVPRGAHRAPRDGLLPPWPEWFEPGTMERLIPDSVRRDTVVAELPRLPLSYFQARVPIPDGWATAPSAYILLSEAYRYEAEQAAARGWPVIEILGSHLDLVSQPLPLAAALRGVGRAASRPSVA